MGTVHTAPPVQTLYITVRRDEWRQLKDENELLKQELAQLRQQTQGYLAQPVPVLHRTPHA
ncbi:hypothetical protein EJA72_03990 [Pseudomonas sp. PB120]|uniref:DUF6026 family protein n=1 Tax=Pseudomonas sp. PB120 TaxID=2494700 RepID=UPI0012FE26D7|nr:DUF6026 family protein [Pseudomonas sp. PB120]MVV47418.1 hypothetical protein [Pseudomonas sp. PB120]